MKSKHCWFVLLALAAVFNFLGAVSAIAQIQVNSSTPSAAPQGSVNLNVTVNGSGFKKGATSKNSLAKAAPSVLGLSSLPVAARPSISAALGRDDFRYRLQAVAGGFRTENPQQSLTADFTAQGLEVRSGKARLGLSARP